MVKEKQRYFMHGDPYKYSPGVGTYEHGFIVGHRAKNNPPAMYKKEHAATSEYCLGFNDGAKQARLEKLLTSG